VLDEAMRAMPDCVVHVTPGRHGSGRVHVSIGGGAYDLLLTIDGADCVSELKLVPVHGVGCAGNALAVLKAGLSMLTAAEGTEQTDTEAEQQDMWTLWNRQTVRWDNDTRQVVVSSDGGSVRSNPIEGNYLAASIRKSEIQGMGLGWHSVIVVATGGNFYLDFETGKEAEAFTEWLDERIREERE